MLHPTPNVSRMQGTEAITSTQDTKGFVWLQILPIMKIVSQRYEIDMIYR